MRDRITELESAVNRLEANIDGLRDQLVEANDRIRQLERDLAAELVDEPAAQRLRGEPHRSTDAADEVRDDHADEDRPEQTAPEADVEDDHETIEDIIVA